MLLASVLLKDAFGEIRWFPFGPFGGDARSIAADPRDDHHLYLGTATGWLYESHDSGASWMRLAQIAQRDDLVIDHILPDPQDPQRLLIGAWTADHPDGGVWISEDAGKTWYAQAQMHGEAVLSLSRSRSDPREIVAGTLRGVYESKDDGNHWNLVSPNGSTEIHEIESVAIDPTNPNIIYVGTWHLPWKTTDGGVHWESIKRGIIDDSDVFSIIVDPSEPKTVYVSACSGIYKSVDAASEFRKIQGIPSTARRTRKLAQDPKHPGTVYAGTTEGLYRTLDAGEHWSRLTGPEVIVNDVYIDPENPDHVLMATDRGGVFSSDNAGESFHASNSGFSSRQVAAYAADPRNPAHLFVGVVNDKQTGGVFASTDGGLRWRQTSDGLDGRDVFSLAYTPDGTLLAGTNHGIFRWVAGSWVDSGAIVAGPMDAPAGGAKRHAEAKAAGRLEARVHVLIPTAGGIYAATSDGLYVGDEYGMKWRPVAGVGLRDVRQFAHHGRTLVAADVHGAVESGNDGQSWKPLALPAALTQVGALAVDGSGGIWIGGREGIYQSEDHGSSWSQVKNLSISDVDSAYFDAANDRMLVTTASSTFVFSVKLPEDSVTYWNSGWKVRFVRPVGDHLVAATLYDGVVLQPQMVDSVLVKATPNGAETASGQGVAVPSTTAVEAPTRR